MKQATIEGLKKAWSRYAGKKAGIWLLTIAILYRLIEPLLGVTAGPETDVWPLYEDHVGLRIQAAWMVVALSASFHIGQGLADLGRRSNGS